MTGDKFETFQDPWLPVRIKSWLWCCLRVSLWPTETMVMFKLFASMYMTPSIPILTLHVGSSTRAILGLWYNTREKQRRCCSPGDKFSNLKYQQVVTMIMKWGKHTIVAMHSAELRTIAYFFYSFFSVPFFISRDIEQVWVWYYLKDSDTNFL